MVSNYHYLADLAWLIPKKNLETSDLIVKTEINNLKLDF